MFVNDKDTHTDGERDRERKKRDTHAATRKDENRVGGVCISLCTADYMPSHFIHSTRNCTACIAIVIITTSVNVSSQTSAKAASAAQV